MSGLEHSHSQSEVDPNAESSISGFSSLCNSQVKLYELLRNAEDDIKAFESPDAPTSEHVLVFTTMEQVKTQTKKYSRAIYKSVDVVDNCYTFSNQAKSLCTYLLDDKTPMKAVVGYVAEMRKTATQAHKATTEMSYRFRSIRTELYEITGKMKAQATGLVMGDQHTSLREHFRLFGGIIKMAWHGKHRDTNDDAALKSLVQIEEGLGKLSSSVDLFVDWWVKMDGILGMLEDGVESLRIQQGKGLNEVQRLIIRTVQKQWGEVAGQYLDYRAKIISIHDTRGHGHYLTS